MDYSSNQASRWILHDLPSYYVRIILRAMHLLCQPSAHTEMKARKCRWFSAFAADRKDPAHAFIRQTDYCSGNSVPEACADR